MTPDEITSMVDPRNVRLGVQTVAQGSLADAAEADLTRRMAEKNIPTPEERGAARADDAMPPEPKAVKVPDAAPFASASEAVTFAAENGLTERVDVVQSPSGEVVLAPRPVAQRAVERQPPGQLRRQDPLGPDPALQQDRGAVVFDRHAHDPPP
jgi:hypothetical protein